MSKKGFTLVELMVVLAVVSVVFLFALPAMSGLIQSNNISSEANRLAASIRFARSEAITRNVSITLSNRGNALQWKDGWETFVDASGGESNFNSVNDTLLRKEMATHSNVHVTSTVNGNNWLSFNADGSLGETSDVTFFICDVKKSTLGTSITIARTGRLVTTGNIAHDDCTK